MGGSRSARTTPQQASSPTKDIRQIRTRSRSNAGDEYERTATTLTASARTARPGATDVTRRSGVSVDAIRRHRTRDDATTDVTARPPAARSTAARQNAPPPAPASTRLRSISQKRPGEVSGSARPQSSRSTQDTTRSQYARSPERGRTSTRQADVVSKMTDTRTSMTGSQGMYRSSSASVLPTPRRTASRSPQRPYVPASTQEQERLQNAREAFKKRMTYDASKSAAMARAAAAGRRSGDGSRGSLERLSPSSSGSRRSSQGSVNDASDEDAFVRSAAAVAKYSSSVACDINALSQRVGSGRALSTVDDDDDLSNMVRCSTTFSFLDDRCVIATVINLTCIKLQGCRIGLEKLRLKPKNVNKSSNYRFLFLLFFVQFYTDHIVSCFGRDL